MPAAYPGEVWLVDLGMVGKVRPCLVLTPPPADNELALINVIPHTTALREGNPWQVEIAKLWLKRGAFHVQQIFNIPPPKLLRLCGTLSIEELTLIKEKLALRLGLRS